MDRTQLVAGRNSATRPDSTRTERVQPIRSAITVDGIVGYAFSNSRICGSTASTTDPFSGRSYFGGLSEARARFTVLRDTPSTRAITWVGHILRPAQTTNLGPILHSKHPFGPPWLG